MPISGLGRAMCGFKRQYRECLIALLMVSIFLGCSSSDSENTPEEEPPVTEPPVFVSIKSRVDAARFLTQATFGPTEEEIERLYAIDAAVWLEEQYAIVPSSYLSSLTALYQTHNLQNKNLEDFLPRYLHFTDVWWHLAVRAPDQLRQRIAFTLSEILVISHLQDSVFNKFRGVAHYHDILTKHAFGNFRDLLIEVTLNPVMGDYLSMRRNEKANDELNIRPDENYAREVLQLFSIGLFQLNLDGSLRLDANNQPINTFDQGTIEGFAKVFTGWNYGDALALRSDNLSLESEVMPMRSFAAFHDNSEKQLLDGQVLSAGQSAREDLEQAIDNIFNHPNVGPFIGKQLIQKLVTSNPSLAYVERVASVFNDNGTGVRGDLGAVIRAVLLDDEARGGHLSNPQTFGKLKEPLLRVTGVWRAFDAVGEVGPYRFVGGRGSFGQAPYESNSVFNFFRPDFSQPGDLEAAELVSPEFQILTESFITETTNRWLEIAWEIDLDNSELSPRHRIILDTDKEKVMAEEPATLINHLNLLLMSGQMSQKMQLILEEYLQEIPYQDGTIRTREAIFFIISSPQFAIQR